MESFTRWVVSRVIPDWEDVRHQSVRSRYGLLEGWVSVVGNLLLSAIKIGMGIALSSVGLLADAVHSLSDMATSVVVIISFKISRKPPDREHPYGHAKAEHIATLVVALLMIMAGYQLGESGIRGLLAGTDTAVDLPLTWAVLAVLLLLVVAKEALAQFSRQLGKMIGSTTLEADALHHRTDALSTGVVILGLAGRNIGWPWLDSVAGVVVAAWVVYTGIRLGYDSVSPLLGEQVSNEDLTRIKDLSQSVEHVVSAHDIAVHNYGHFYFTTIHAEVSDRLDVHEMHGITVLIEQRVLKRYPGQCVVHVDPVNLYHPLLHEVSDALRDLVVGHEDLVEFRDLNLWSDNGSEHCEVEVSVEPEVPEQTYRQLAQQLEADLVQAFPKLDVTIRLTVDFSATPIS